MESTDSVRRGRCFVRYLQRIRWRWFLRDLFNHECDCIQFTATEEVLFMGRDSRVDIGSSVLNGPDAGRLGHDNADFNHEVGYRVSLGVQSPNAASKPSLANTATGRGAMAVR